jgi:predicted Zn-dependent protease with MMP-like domain
MEEDDPAVELNAAERDRFDRLLEDAIEALPPAIRELIEHVPVVVLDSPTPVMLASLKRDGVLEQAADGLDLCGLHTGVAITQRSVEDPGGWGGLAGGGEADAESGGPERIHLFRKGIIDLAGGWEQPQAEEEVYEEIRITLLHEIGHHFGLEEDDLEDLGYA